MRRCAVPISFALARRAAARSPLPAGGGEHRDHPALAIDLFPVDDWVGDGLKKAKDVVFGGISLGADAIAHLLVTVLATLVDLLIPQSFVDAGLGGDQVALHRAELQRQAGRRAGLAAQPAARRRAPADAHLDRRLRAAARPGLRGRPQRDDALGLRRLARRRCSAGW